MSRVVDQRSPTIGSLGRRISERRLHLGLSPDDVAGAVEFWNDSKKEWVKLSRAAYVMYERGDVVPDIHKVEQIAKALDCSPAWLAFGDRVG